MKRITAMLLSLLLGAGLLTVCWRGAEYHREDTERENGVTLYVRRDRQAAFAGNLTWDGQSDTVDYVIPDRVDGAPVTALGGLLYGTAFTQVRKQNHGEQQYFGSVKVGSRELQFRVLGEPYPEDGSPRYAPLVPLKDTDVVVEISAQPYLTDVSFGGC